MSAVEHTAPAAPTAVRVADPSVGERVAGKWVAQHRAGRRVARVRTHSTLYRGPHDASTRVGVVLDGDGPDDELTLLVRDREGELSVSAFPDDPLLPTLAAVVCGRALDPLLRSAGLGSSSGATGFGYQASLVHHPREGACVLRVRVGDAEAYAKVYPRAEDATAAADRLYAVGSDRLVAPGGAVVRLPRVLAVSSPLRTVLLESLTPPRPSGLHPGGDAPLTVEEYAEALRALHAHRPAGALPLVRAGEHLGRVRREQALVATAWPDLSDRVDEAIHKVASALSARAPDDQHVLCHGDFTPGQLVRLEEGLGLLDLDTASLGDPACDIGRFLAYERVRRARSVPEQALTGDAGAAFLTAYGSALGTADDPACEARVRAYHQLNLVLIALRAARRLKAARSSLALRLLDDSDPIPGRLP